MESNEIDNIVPSPMGKCMTVGDVTEAVTDDEDVHAGARDDIVEDFKVLLSSETEKGGFKIKPCITEEWLSYIRNLNRTIM
jgi:hypothetical protein